MPQNAVKRSHPPLEFVEHWGGTLGHHNGLEPCRKIECRVPMQAIRTRKKRQQRSTLPYRDFYRAILAGLLLIFVFAASFYDGRLLPDFDEPQPANETSKDKPEHPLRTGSIVIVPTSGNRCKQRIIDNATWIIRDHGIVDCEEMLSVIAERASRDTATHHLDAIRNSFFRSK
jgi:hypothetical protein